MQALLHPDPIRIRTNTAVFCDKKFVKIITEEIYIFSLLQESHCIKNVQNGHAVYAYYYYYFNLSD
jgi:hypothetical protein